MEISTEDALGDPSNTGSLVHCHSAFSLCYTRDDGVRRSSGSLQFPAGPPAFSGKVGR